MDKSSLSLSITDRPIQRLTLLTAWPILYWKEGTSAALNVI